MRAVALGPDRVISLHAKLLAPGIGGVPKRPFDVAGICCVYGRPVALGAVDESHIVAHGSTAVRYHRQGLDIEAPACAAPSRKFRGSASTIATGSPT
jgi:hypothetical protein